LAWPTSLSYAQTPALLESLWNSLWVSGLVTAITIPLAFGFAYALTRSCMPFKPLFRGITLVPLLAPSLLAAISLIYWFGNQGVLKAWLTASASRRSTARRALWWPNALRCFRMR
jgi:iron(III) transport system permease protein